MTRPAIVVATYNRPNSLKRILKSLNDACYEDAVLLVISIDYQDSVAHSEVVEIANQFAWKHGEKKIIHHTSNLGLRKHIIKCGNLTNDYDAIIMLEDDIYVSPQFYKYSVSMLERYGNDEYIAGISLYKHLWNVNAGRPFIPENDGNDVYFMQFAQSWGQCWSKRMWSEFYNWYEKDEVSIFLNNVDIPLFVRSWSEKSWLKYFIAYVVLTNKYFVYPYESLSTNFNDIGSHVRINNSTPQVPLMIVEKKYCNLPVLSEGIRYDAFFEREGMGMYAGFQDADLCVDIYGTKGNAGKRRYWLTTVAAPYCIIRSFGMDHKPVEQNIILNNPGNNIFLYDITIPSSIQKNNNSISEILYDIRDLSTRKLLKLLLYRLKNKFL